MSSSSKKSNDELINEQKQIHHKPQDLMDTDAEEEFKEGDKKGFRQQVGKPSDSTTSGSKFSERGKPSNEQLEKEQSQMKLKPDELKDTDVEDEFQEGGEKKFRQQKGNSTSGGGNTAPKKEEMEQGHYMRAPPDEMKDFGAKNGGKSKL